jgi:hypothetical protein
MRMRIISAVVVAGLGIVGIALAQQADDQPKDQAGERAILRAQVAKLRAEVELQQLEHEVDVDILRKLMTDMRNLDAIAALKGPLEAELKSFKDTQTRKLLDILPAGLASLEEIKKSLHDDARAQTQVDEVTAKLARPFLERLKKEFVLKATTVNEKRLELGEADKRYKESR